MRPHNGFSWDELQRQASFLKMGPEILGRLVDEHAAALVLYARQWCSTPEDVVQNAFAKLAALRNSPENVVPWLYRVVRNEAISALRASERRRRHERLAAGRVPVWFITVDEAAPDIEAATAALQTLPLQEREIIVAHLWGGLTFEQIAELTGVSSSTAHRCYTAGLSALRERLGVPCPRKDTNRS